MKHLNKLLLVIVAGLMLAQCTTYKVKSDLSKGSVVNKTPKWYVKYDRETMFKYSEAATAVSPDMELAVKMNNTTIINKVEQGTNEKMTIAGNSQDTINNVIADSVAKGYEVVKSEIYTTKHKSYRAYILIEIKKKDIENL
jgi:hypothetical protein